MKPMKEYDWLDWFAFGYAVLSVLVMIAFIVIHVIDPW
jgi:hypothetical protein